MILKLKNKMIILLLIIKKFLALNFFDNEIVFWRLNYLSIYILIFNKNKSNLSYL